MRHRGTGPRGEYHAIDDSTIPAVLAELGRELQDLLGWVSQTPELDLGTAETETFARLRTIGTPCWKPASPPAPRPNGGGNSAVAGGPECTSTGIG